MCSGLGETEPTRYQRQLTILSLRRGTFDFRDIQTGVLRRRRVGDSPFFYMFFAPQRFIAFSKRGGSLTLVLHVDHESVFSALDHGNGDFQKGIGMDE